MQPTVYLVSNAVHMYAVYILFTAVLGKSKLHQFAEILTYIVYYLINCGVYLFMDNIMGAVKKRAIKKDCNHP